MTTSKPKAKRQVGFLGGQTEIPDDFDRMYEDEIVALFEDDDVLAIAEAEVPGEGGTE